MWKWGAWNACKGLVKEAAMIAFIKEVEQVEPSFKQKLAELERMQSTEKIATTPVVVSKPASISQSAAVTFEGILYKQRDVFKGWRPRHFALQDVFLHYYLEKDDLNPRKSLDLTGCSVDIIKTHKVDDTEYFPFIVSHPKSAKMYNLAALSKKDADDWVAAISKAAKQSSDVANAPEPASRLLPRRPPIVSEEEAAGSSPR